MLTVLKKMGPSSSMRGMMLHDLGIIPTQRVSINQNIRHLVTFPKTVNSTTQHKMPKLENVHLNEFAFMRKLNRGYGHTMEFFI